MNEIKCPKCGTLFAISETDYNKVVSQIKDKEFFEEIKLKEKEIIKDKENTLKLMENQYKEDLNKKDYEISSLKKELESKIKEKEMEYYNKYKDEINKKSLEISELNAKIKLEETNRDLKIKEAISEKEKIINDLNNKLSIKEAENLLKEKNIKESYEEKLKNKDEQISYYKDFKARQSTKMIGESLEKHCSYEFNKLRSLFKNAYFEKDNDASSGSKGDFIFRDYDEYNNEIVSIMFEMKNEQDETSTKHKNEDFFKELDKDRNEKNCEYAVLVSLLEIDNELYNTGITDVSHKYKKMYVIRPQFFIPLITLIRNMALNSLEYKKELINIKNQNIDISHFEENMNNFKTSFNRNYRLASEKFTKAIMEIDKSIEHLQKIKDALISSENNLRLANNKVDDLTIKKLTHNSKTMEDMFESLKEEKQNKYEKLESTS